MRRRDIKRVEAFRLPMAGVQCSLSIQVTRLCAAASALDELLGQKLETVSPDRLYDVGTQGGIQHDNGIGLIGHALQRRASTAVRIDVHSSQLIPLYNCRA